jgi:hypothetical protein
MVTTLLGEVVVEEVEEGVIMEEAETSLEVEGEEETFLEAEEEEGEDSTVSCPLLSVAAGVVQSTPLWVVWVP